LEKSKVINQLGDRTMHKHTVKLTRDIELNIRFNDGTEKKIVTTAGIKGFHTFKDAANYAFNVNSEYGEYIAIYGKKDSKGETHYL
jgi:hypothetical protein